MFPDILQADRAGGASFPTAEPGEGFHRRLIGLGATATQGTILLQANVDSDPLLDSGRAVGDRSVAMTVMKPAEEALYGGCGIYSVANPEAGVTVAEDAEVPVIYGKRMVKCRVFVPDGGLKPLQGLMADFVTTPGVLIPKDGTQKVIALVAQKVPDPGAAAAEQLVLCYFDGSYGFGI